MKEITGSINNISYMWTVLGSNQRPLPCHGSALPTAPTALLCLYYINICVIWQIVVLDKIILGRLRDKTINRLKW